ncbi:MAG: ATP-binding protein [Clostridia bacterium]|nr:ATP-binding protein [Clostridia bacterium]
MKSKDASGKKIRKPRSLNKSLWLYFCLLLVLLIILVELVFSIVMTQNLENGATKEVSQVCDEIVFTIQGLDIASGDYSTGGTGTEETDADEIPQNAALDTETVLNQSVLSYFRNGMPVWIYNDEGEIVAPSGDMVGEMFSPDDSDTKFSDVQARLAGYQEGTAVIFRTFNYLNGAVRISTPDETYYVVVSYSTIGLQSVISSTMLYLLIVGISVLIIGLIVAYFISQRVTRGVQELSSSARKLAKGDYTATFANVDYVELAELSDTLNEMRDEVKKTSDFQKEILANVTHDLKTPITMIKAYASMIQDFSGDDPVKRNKHLQVIIDESDRLTGLINDVLDVSKVSSNLDTMTPKVFNLTEFLYSIINKFSYLQETQGYNIMVDIDPDQYTRADIEKIGQVIYNLVGNAANYTGEDKTIYISLKSNMEGTRIRFSVRDTGKGIAKDELDSIWDRYYRSKKDHVRPVKGTGLGLNICKIILNNHKFDFGVESELGKGSTFWVDFPSVPAESIEAAKSEDIKEAAAAAAASNPAPASPAPSQDSGSIPVSEPSAVLAPRKKRQYNRKPRPVPADTPAETFAETPETAPADTPDEAPSAPAAKAPVPAPADAHAEDTDTSAADVTNTPADVPEPSAAPAPRKKRQYNRKPKPAPADMPADTPVETPETAPAETPIETPAETPIETPAETHAESPAEIPATAPADAPAEVTDTPTDTDPVVNPEASAAPAPRKKRQYNRKPKAAPVPDTPADTPAEPAPEEPVQQSSEPEQPADSGEDKTKQQ